MPIARGKNADDSDGIANGTHEPRHNTPHPLSLFTAPRVDYSLHRLRHYTGTSPEHFQNFTHSRKLRSFAEVTFR